MAKNKMLTNYKLHSTLTGWSIGLKPVGQNDVFTIRPKYYHKTENLKAKMMIRPIFFIVIALLLTNYYMTEYYV